MSEEIIEESQEDKDLNFISKIISMLKGRQDLKKRIEVLLDPRIPQTSTQLTAPQANFVVIANWISEEYPEFEPLQAYADNVSLTMLSHKGFGIKSTIELQKALTHGERETLIHKETIPQKIKRTVRGEPSQ